MTISLKETDLSVTLPKRVATFFENPRAIRDHAPLGIRTPRSFYPFSSVIPHKIVPLHTMHTTTSFSQNSESMERLLHYTWQHRLFPLETLRTTEGEEVEVIDPGQHNDDAGPDFFNAKVRIGGHLWAGNVEVHQHASDWFRHHHDTDARYNNVVLHVVETDDAVVHSLSGRKLPQLVLCAPDSLAARYQTLLIEDRYPPCHSILPHIAKLHVHAWLNALTAERLAAKAERIDSLLRQTAGDWERTFFITLARTFGFGKNTEAFERWAMTINLQQVGKHRDQAGQVEAFFLGQAGLLDDESLAPERRDDHFRTLQAEYRYLSHKFSLTPLPHTVWKFLRLRPQNFPYRRLAQLATLYYTGQLNFAKMRQHATPEAFRTLFLHPILPYWTHRYTFGEADGSVQTTKSAQHPAPHPTPLLSPAMIDLVMINTVVPLLFAYGRQHHDTSLTDRALALLESLRPERNAITRTWSDLGIVPQHAADSQALLHLRLRYCDRKDCLRCRFGTFFLRKAQQQTAPQKDPDAPP